MKDSLQRSANSALSGVGWMRVAGVQSGQLQSWFGHSAPNPWKHELDVRLEERQRERRRITRELHDTLFQGFLGASMILRNVVDQLPADSPNKNSLSRALSLIHRVIAEGRETLDGVRSRVDKPTNLEKAFADLCSELTPVRGQLRISVMGSPLRLDPAVQEQVYLIGREALVNALRHSGATVIELDIEYLSKKLRVVVRDNGSGIDPKMVESARNSHLGLVGMHERAENIGAQLQIWSRKGAGTEVEISLPIGLAVSTTAT